MTESRYRFGYDQAESHLIYIEAMQSTRYDSLNRYADLLLDAICVVDS